MSAIRARPNVCLVFVRKTDFAAVLQALRTGRPLPFAYDPDYLSPSTRIAHA
jgi:UDP-glucose 4-epimerase